MISDQSIAFLFRQITVENNVNPMTLIVTFIIDLRGTFAAFSLSLSVKSAFYSNDHLHSLIELSDILVFFRADGSHCFGIAIQSIGADTYTESIDRLDVTRRWLDR